MRVIPPSNNDNYLRYPDGYTLSPPWDIIKPDFLFYDGEVWTSPPNIDIGKMVPYIWKDKKRTEMKWDIDRERSNAVYLYTYVKPK